MLKVRLGLGVQTTIQTYLHNKQGDADVLRQADGSSEVPS